MEFQTEGIGKNAAELEELANESRIVQALQHGLANASRETKDEFIAASTALKDKRIDEEFRKTSVEINNQVNALKFQTAAVGRSGEALLVLNAAQKINAINTSELARAHADLAAKVIAGEKALLAQQIAAGRIQTGQQGIGVFQQQYGADDPMSMKIAGARAAELFKVGFDNLWAQKGTEDQQVQKFIQFIQQQLAAGVPDIQELLLNKGMTGGQLESMKLSAKKLGYGDLMQQLDANMQSGQQWGSTFDDEVKQYTERMAKAGNDLEGFQKHYEDLAAAVVKGVALKIDVSEATDAVDEVARRIAGIPDVSHKTIIVDVQYNDSTNLLTALEQEVRRGTGLDSGFRVYN